MHALFCSSFMCFSKSFIVVAPILKQRREVEVLRCPPRRDSGLAATVPVSEKVSLTCCGPEPEVNTQVLFEAALSPEPCQVLKPGAAVQGAEPAGVNEQRFQTGALGGGGSSSSTESRSCGAS